MSSQLFKFSFTKPAVAKTPSTTTEINKPLVKEMTNEVFNQYRSLIYKLCGIYFTDSKKYLLEGRVVRRLTTLKIRTFEEYLSFIESSTGRSELNELFEAITINETYFFRAPQQFDALETRIIPELIESKRGFGLPTIKI